MSGLKKLVCLNMIVKNESEVIRRCLNSLRSVIDYWVIVDTGSTDGTQDIIREHMRDIPGELHERVWRDFAHNRSEALMLARGKCDYTLIIDADDSLEVTDRSALSKLGADQYMMKINDTGIVYYRPQLVRSALDWRYEGVLHEYLTCEAAEPAVEISGVEIRLHQDGARRKNPSTYISDAAVLEAAIQVETNPFLLTRYQFYLAQSYRDSGRLSLAVEHYLNRAQQGYWIEEVFISLYCVAQLKEQLSHADDDVVAAYLSAADVLPTRVEALHRASRFCRHKGRYEEGYRIAKRGLAVSMPADALFVEPVVYEYGLRDEFALNAYWSGHSQESLDACLEILAAATLTPDEARRIGTNAQFAGARLARGKNLAVHDDGDRAARRTARSARLPQAPFSALPNVLAVLQVAQTDELLSIYLQCIGALDYPKSAIHVVIRDSAAQDSSRKLCREWASRMAGQYAGVAFESEQRHDGSSNGQTADVDSAVSPNRARGWALIHEHAVLSSCKFILVAESDCFILPAVLRGLVGLNLPIVAPFLRSLDQADLYSNYHADIEPNGYFRDCEQYDWIAKRLVRGIIKVPVVKGAYLARADLARHIWRDDGTIRHDYVILADQARRSGIDQFIDNREIYGYIVRATEGQLRNSHEDTDKLSRLLRNEAEIHAVPDAEIIESNEEASFAVSRRADNTELVASDA